MDDDVTFSTVSTLSDGQEIALSLLGVFSGTLSVLGSSTIVYKVIANRSKATPYDRLMLGLSSCDVVASVSYAIQPFLLPEDTSQRVWARGTDATCSFLGFLAQFAFAAIFYNGMLSFYYLLTVRFGVRRKHFARRYEIWMHLFTLVFFLGTASAGAVVGVYSELALGQGCWVNDYPKGCEDYCISHYIGWGFGAIPTLFTFLALIINNLVIYFHVKDVLGEGEGQAEDERTIRQKTQIREVSTQGFLYVGTFFVAYLFAFIVRVLESLGYTSEDEAGIYLVLVLSAFLLPLQGFFNMFVFNRPNYVRVRAAYPELSSFWAIRKACLDSDIPRLTETQLSSRTKSGRGSKPRNKSGSRRSEGFSSNLFVVREGSNEDASKHEGFTEGSNSGNIGIQLVDDASPRDDGATLRKPLSHDFQVLDVVRCPKNETDLKRNKSSEVFGKTESSLRRVGMDGTIIDNCPTDGENTSNSSSYQTRWQQALALDF